MLHTPDHPDVEWVKSTHSTTNGECVEVATLSDGSVAVRDSKDPEGAVLRFTRGEMLAFVRGVRAGEFDEFC